MRTNSEISLRVYSNVNMLSSVTFPKLLASKVLSSERSTTFSFLNYRPLCNLTFASTFVAMTGRESMFAKSLVRVIGFTRSI